MTKDINKDKFDESTKCKLNIFRNCFKEWFPVFLHSEWAKEVYIFDFFAGSGTDIEGKFGSSLILLEVAKGENRKYCSKVSKPIKFTFCESQKKKCQELNDNVAEYIKTCEVDNKCSTCVYKLDIINSDFKSIFNDKQIQSIFQNKHYAKFVLLDQYGFRQIDDNIFKQLIKYPKTDFIFFISSSFIKRFKEHPNTTMYIDTQKIDFENSTPKECHKIITDYFKELIPEDIEYYLHNFTIKKGSNYYGLILGTNHTLGMEKFLKVCWQEDENSGESNFNINNDIEEGDLFYDPSNSAKKVEVRKIVEKEILSRRITDNIEGFKFVLEKGCKPELFTNVAKKLEKEQKIIRIGKLSYKSTEIHKAEKYKIELKNNENQ
jgi:three-Cys-motif partner protein